MKISPQVWSTKKVEDVMRQINKIGVMPKYNPFHGGDSQLRKADLRWENTPEEDAEYGKIITNPIYFAENYAEVMTDDGVVKVKELRKYQKKNLIALHKYKNNVWLASRQSGKSITVAIYIAHYILTHKDRNILLISRNGDKVKELVVKIDTILRRLPFWLKPGIVTDQVYQKIYDNGVSLIAERTTPNAGASVTAHLVYVDEFALINPKFKAEFWSTVYPTLSSSKIAKMILTSTPRGLDKFWEIYDGALNSKNTFHPMRTDWFEVPGHDEQWRLDQIGDLGSEEIFNQEFGNQFLSGNKLLFHSSVLRKLKALQTEFVHHDIEELDDRDIQYKGILKWHPHFNLEVCKDPRAKFVFSVDLADGHGGDYSIINMFQIIAMTKAEIDKLQTYGDEKDFFKLVQIGICRTNEVSIEGFAQIMYHLVTDVFELENVKVVVETNHEGTSFVDKVDMMYGDENEVEVESFFVHFKANKDSERMRLGLQNNEQIKELNCTLIKDKVKYNQLMMIEQRTVAEGLTFAKNKKGKYESEGNDDAIMTCINITSYFDTFDFIEQVDDMFPLMPKAFVELVYKKLNRRIPGTEEDEEDNYAEMVA